MEQKTAVRRARFLKSWLTKITALIFSLIFIYLAFIVLRLLLIPPNPQRVAITVNKTDGSLQFKLTNNTGRIIWYAQNRSCGIPFWGVEQLVVNQWQEIPTRQFCLWAISQNRVTLLLPGAYLAEVWDMQYYDTKVWKPKQIEPGVYRIFVPFSFTAVKDSQWPSYESAHKLFVAYSQPIYFP